MLMVAYLTSNQEYYNRKGLIVAYRKLAQNGNETEEQTPIHIKDVESITRCTIQGDNVFTSLRRELEVDVGVECGKQRAKKDVVTTTLKTRHLLDVNFFDNISMYVYYYSMKLRQLDVETTFPYADLEEDVSLS